MANSRRALITSTFSGMFLWGVIASIAPLGKSWPFVPDTGIFRVLLVLIGPMFSLVGSFIMGFLSDFIGRKKIFIITVVLYSIGLMVISLSFSVLELIIGIALSDFGVAGEEIPTISILAEDTGKKSRASLVTNGMNFSNIGSAFIAGVFLLISLSQSTLIVQRLMIGIMSAALIALIVYSRSRMPESFRWLGTRGYTDQSRKEMKKLEIGDIEESDPSDTGSYSLRYFLLGTMALSQYLTFGLMIYIIPYYEFSSARTIDILVFFGLIGASIAGPIGARLLSFGRKSYSLFSFSGGLISVLIILILTGSLGNMFIFVPLVFVNMFFSEFAWAARTILEPELFSTATRGRGIAIVRLIPMIAYPITIILFANLNLFQEILSNLVLWSIGLAGVITWFFLGKETVNLELDFRKDERIV